MTTDTVGGVSLEGRHCFLNHGHLVLVSVAPGSLVDVALSEARSSCAVTFSGSEYSLQLESVIWTRMCVGWLTVADVRPGPLT